MRRERLRHGLSARVKRLLGRGRERARKIWASKWMASAARNKLWPYQETDSSTDAAKIVTENATINRDGDTLRRCGT